MFDDEVLNALNLTRTEIAKRLRVTPQAVSIGLKRAKAERQRFFTVDRVARLYSSLNGDQESVAQSLHSAVTGEREYRLALVEAGKRYVAATPYAQLYAEFQSVDFFGLTPKEFISDQARRYLKRATLTTTASLDIAYFLPADECRHAHSEYARRFKPLIDSSALRVTFWGSDIFRFLLPAICATGRNASDRRLFLQSANSPLDIKQVDQPYSQPIFDHLRALGIRYSDDTALTLLPAIQNILGSITPLVIPGERYNSLAAVEFRLSG